MIVTGYSSVDPYGTFTILECEHCGEEERLMHPNGIAHKRCYGCRKNSFFCKRDSWNHFKVFF